MLNRLKTRLVVTLLVLLTLSSCSGPLGFLTGLGGGGTNVLANTQAGRVNTQTVGTTQNLEQRLDNVSADRIRQSSDTNRVQADRVENVVVNEIPAWIILLLVLGWLLPTPQHIGSSFLNLFRRKPKT